MAYRLCTFDQFGRITSISAASYASNLDVIPEIAAINPLAYGFVDESVLPTGELLETLVDGANQPVPAQDGFNGRIRVPPSVSAMYDPRTEVSAYIDNPIPYITYGTRVIQDITKVVASYNIADSTTKPYHSTTQKKFGPTSGRFTKSGSGYSGGLLYITNLSKTTYTGGYTAPHNNVAVLGVPSYAIELFFYPTSTASNFTLVQKGPTGASANWKLGYDSGAGFLQFAWQSYGSSGGYNYSQNIINTAGLTTNMWHHVAVALVKNGAGVCYQMSGYFNGANRFSTGVTVGSFPETRFNNGLYIGNNSVGTESFDGYIDSFRMLESGNTSGIFGISGYGFLPFGGGTLSVPTTVGFTRGSETCVLLNFNGQPSSSNFYCESTEYVSGTVNGISEVTTGATGATLSQIYTELMLRNVVRYSKDYTGASASSDPTGFSTNYGPIVNPYISSSGATGQTYHGYDYVFGLYYVFDNQPSLNVYKTNYLKDLTFNRGIELMAFIEGASGNRGSSGAVLQTSLGTNPFRRLFSGSSGNSYGSCGNHNSLYIDPLNSNVMAYIMDNGYLATQGISYSSYTFVDGKGITRTLSSNDMINLRSDILEHQSKIKAANNTAKIALTTATSKSSIIGTIEQKQTGKGYAADNPLTLE
jgi:hypothetical protein